MQSDQSPLVSITALVLFVASALGVISTPAAIEDTRPDAWMLQKSRDGQFFETPARLWQDVIAEAWKDWGRRTAELSKRRPWEPAVVTRMPSQGNRTKRVNGTDGVTGVNEATLAGESSDPKAGAKARAEPCAELAAMRPFALVEGVKKLVKALQSRAGLRKARLGEIHPAKVLFLPVHIPGGCFPEHQNRRVRMRYAVQAALHQSGFEAIANDSIRYFPVRVKDPRCFAPEDSELRKNCRGSTFLVPYKVYKRTEPSWGYGALPPDIVITLWLDVGFLGDQPAQRMGHLMAYLAREMFSEGDAVDPKMAVIGPMGSEGLRALHDERAASSLPEDKLSAFARPEHYVFYSTSATVPSTRLGHDERPATGRGMAEFRIAAGTGARVLRVMGNDEVLARAIVDELALRIDLARDEVAIVAEWDSLFAREMPTSFRKAIVEHLEKRKTTVSENDTLLSNLHTFRYLKGIDGRIADETKRNLESSRIISDSPTGLGQADYIRRITSEVVSAKRNFRAVGILGSDVYDKLFLIQFLRRHFPEAVLFTTDLDDRLLCQRHYSKTRNLIIASHYGLSLRPELQGATPPFRDAYQTATYRATLLAVGNLAARQAEHPVIDPTSSEGSRDAAQAGMRVQMPHPAIYEVARSGAYNLTFKSKLWPTYHILILVVGVLAVILFLLPFNSTLRDFSHQILLEPHKAAAWTLLALIPVFAFFLVAAYDHDSPSGEPLAFFEGISIWPADLIRVIAVLVCWYSIYACHKLLTENQHDIGCTLFGDEDKECEAPPTGRAWWAALAKPFRKFNSDWKASNFVTAFRKLYIDTSITCWSDSQSKTAKMMKNCGLSLPGTDKAEEVWRGYVERGEWMRSIIRFTPHLVVFFLISLGVFSLIGFPNRPGRGSLVLAVDKTCLTIAVLSVVFLIFQVFDSTRLTNALVHILTSEKLKWSKSLLKNYPGPKISDDSVRSAWLRWKLIGRRTEAVEKTIYYPFIGIFILALSRNPLFDNMIWPTSLVIVVALAAGVAATSGVLLRLATRRSKARLLEELRRRVDSMSGPKQESKANRVRKLIEEISADHSGAYSSFLTSPLIRAIIIPSGGLGALHILQVLGTS